MKSFIAISFLLIAFGSLAQQGVKTLDSLLQQVDSLSIRSTFPVKRADSFETNIKHKLDSVSGRLNYSIDSLTRLNLPQDKYLNKLDSLMKKTQASLAEKFSNRSDSLTKNANEALERYQEKLRLRTQKLDSLATAAGIDLNQPNLKFTSIDADYFKMPEVGSPGFNKPEAPVLPGINIPGASLPDLNLPELENITGKMDKLSEATGKVEEYSSRTKELNKEHLKEEVQKLPGEIEEEAKNLDAIGNVNKELAQTDKVKDQLDAMQSKAIDPGEVKSDVKNRSKKLLVDHFAGKQETVNKGLQQLEKYQRKFNSVADIRYAPKRRPNALKGKPLIDRLTPGLTFQAYSLEKSWKGIDISPSLEYGLTDRWRAGIAGIYRVNLNTREVDISVEDNVYGFRSLLNYKFYKGFHAHLDAQALRMPEYMLNNSPTTTDPESRAWDYSVNMGLFKNYKISKTLRGTMLILYDLTEIGEIFNTSQIAFRFGVELKLRKRKVGDLK